jgi:hypothetical protein
VPSDGFNAKGFAFASFGRLALASFGQFLLASFGQFIVASFGQIGGWAVRARRATIRSRAARHLRCRGGARRPLGSPQLASFCQMSQLASFCQMPGRVTGTLGRRMHVGIARAGGLVTAACRHLIRLSDRTRAEFGPFQRLPSP